MKYNSHLVLFLVFTLSILFFGCNNLNKETTLSGHWYSCSKRGDYVELHLKANQYKYSSNFGIVTPWNPFSSSSDTLFQFDHSNLKDSTFVNRAIFQFSGQDDLILNYLTSDEIWVFHRMKEKVNNLENDSILLLETLQRSEKINCKDFRTEEEQKEDAPVPKIDFQF